MICPQLPRQKRLCLRMIPSYTIAVHFSRQVRAPVKFRMIYGQSASGRNVGTQLSMLQSPHIIMLLTLRKGRSRDPSRPVLTLDSVLVPLVEHTRHLGVILTSNLPWSDHVNSLLQRQRFNIFLLKRLAQRRNSSEVVKKLYIGLVRPAFEYASAVWDNCTQQGSSCP